MNHPARENEPPTSYSLLQSAQRGDPDGWRQIATIYGPVIYGWARRCGCQSADAADIMQETLTAMSGALARFENQPDTTFRGWLWTITRNKMRDQTRRQREISEGGTEANLRLHQTPDPAADALNRSEPPSDLQSDLATARTRALLLLRDSFDPRAWRMFWETAVQGRDATAVAEEMNVSRWAVYKARARVLQRLQARMAGIE